jgi:DNA-binding beta-propeller fold protein YncE
MKRLVLFLTGLALASNGIAHADPAVLYAASNSRGTQRLLVLNPANGAVVRDVGPIGSGITGLAVDPSNGVLYGSVDRQSATYRSSLVTINRDTGAATLVGSYQQGGETMADITFDPTTGLLYGWLAAAGQDDLYLINKITGQATKVGESGLGAFGSGLDADLSGTIFFTGSGGTGPLRTIDKLTGTPTTVATLSNGPLGSDAINALEFNTDSNSPDFGKLFGIQFHQGANLPSAYLITIDTATGVITSRGQTVGALDAIAFEIPEPSSSVLVILGLLGIVRRRSKR